MIAENASRDIIESSLCRYGYGLFLINPVESNLDLEETIISTILLKDSRLIEGIPILLRKI